MAITKKQRELDLLKWEKSQLLGYDACGTFDYCVNCDKTLENPCDKAYKKLDKKTETKKSTTKTAAAKTVKATDKKTETKSAATKTAETKKPATKKSSAKK